MPFVFVFTVNAYYWIIVISCLTVVSLLFALLRPYKDDWINIWDSVVFGLYAFSLFWVMYSQYIVSLPFEVIGITLTGPFVYIVVYVVHTYILQVCLSTISSTISSAELIHRWNQ